MLPLKFNADFEQMLFKGQVGSPALNESLEFLLLFLEEAPLFTKKIYSEDYLSYVESVTGEKPQLTSTGKYQNWWGSLDKPEVSRMINSKFFSLQFNSDAKVIKDLSEIQLEAGKKYLAKSPSGMSGQEIQLFDSESISSLQGLLKKNPEILIEPFFKREHDFSSYIFSSEKILTYENLVNQRFQYRGTIVQNSLEEKLSNLSFYGDISSSDWEKFISDRNAIIKSCSDLGVIGGYSIDSFTYWEEGKLKIRSICEVNYRKTMGLVAHKLTDKFAKKNSYNALVMGKGHPLTRSILAPFLWQKDSKRGCLLLSPGDTRFEILFITGKNQIEVRKILSEIRRLLPDSDLPVKI